MGLLNIRCSSASPVASKQKLMQSDPLSPFRSNLWLVRISSRHMLPKLVCVNCPFRAPRLTWTASNALPICWNSCFSSLAERNVVFLLWMFLEPVDGCAELPRLAWLMRLVDKSFPWICVLYQLFLYREDLMNFFDGRSLLRCSINPLRFRLWHPLPIERWLSIAFV